MLLDSYTITTVEGLNKLFSEVRALRGFVVHTTHNGNNLTAYVTFLGKEGTFYYNVTDEVLEAFYQQATSHYFYTPTAAKVAGYNVQESVSFEGNNMALPKTWIRID